MLPKHRWGEGKKMWKNKNNNKLKIHTLPKKKQRESLFRD
jgi:hypothetical protein